MGRWGDAQYAVVLYRTSSYREAFRLIETAVVLDDLARRVLAQAARLDEQEAPQREIARQKKERGRRPRVVRRRTGDRPLAGVIAASDSARRSRSIGLLHLLRGRRAAKMERVSQVLQLTVIVEGRRSFARELQLLEKLDFFCGRIASE